MAGTRRSFERGHRPKFLVVVDGTPESGRALRFAARRCARTGASLLMLGVAEPPDNFEWIGVGEALREEAREEAETRLAAARAEAASAAPIIVPEEAVRIGDKAEVIRALIEEDEDISFLVLAAGTGASGPGPLVTALAASANASFPVPVVIVPGDLGDASIDALAG